MDAWPSSLMAEGGWISLVLLKIQCHFIIYNAYMSKMLLFLDIIWYSYFMYFLKYIIYYLSYPIGDLWFSSIPSEIQVYNNSWKKRGEGNKCHVEAEICSWKKKNTKHCYYFYSAEGTFIPPSQYSVLLLMASSKTMGSNSQLKLNLAQPMGI